MSVFTCEGAFVCEALIGSWVHERKTKRKERKTQQLKRKLKYSHWCHLTLNHIPLLVCK